MEIDRLAGTKCSRSALIERILRSYAKSQAHAEIQARDVEQINKAAKRLNSEAADVLEYQSFPRFMT